MPLIVTAHKAWSRLYDRFKLKGYQAISKIPLLELIMPVTIVDELLKDYKATGNVTKDLSGAAVYVAFLSAPKGKRYQVIGWKRPATTGNTVRAMQDENGNEFRFDAANASTANDGWFAPPITLDEGASIGMYGTTDGGDTGVTCQFYLIEEESY